jgi:hypothetical protein
MDNTELVRRTLIKLLAIIGFLAIGFAILWLAIQGIKRLPQGFASLASIAESLQKYRPVEDLSVRLEKSVLNSGEAFELSWNDMRQPGEYRFSYACTEGVALEVREASGNMRALTCGETLSLPEDAQNLLLSIKSEEMRFTDVPLRLTFENSENKTAFDKETKVTVVNAAIPFKDDLFTEEDQEKESKPVAQNQANSFPAPAPAGRAPTPISISAIAFPQSNPNGFVDLSLRTVGIGVIDDGEFKPSASYDEDFRNVIKFDVKNIGTKTSPKWTFRTQLPGGQVYRSDTQMPLKPLEHVTFTMEFSLDEDTRSRVDIITTVSVDDDSVAKNNRSVWTVRVQD